MIRLLLCAVIILGCSYMGVFLSRAFTKREKQLSELQVALAQLEFDVDFRCVPLEESLLNMGKACGDGLKKVFFFLSEEISRNRCVDMHRLWHRALKRFHEDLFFLDGDRDIILDFARNLGFGDREAEKNNIKMAAAKLKLAEDEARETAKRNVKMYRGLGILSGIFIVIVVI